MPICCGVWGLRGGVPGGLALGKALDEGAAPFAPCLATSGVLHHQGQVDTVPFDLEVTVHRMPLWCVAIDGHVLADLDIPTHTAGSDGEVAYSGILQTSAPVDPLNVPA